jgi:hypothetical protein
MWLNTRSPPPNICTWHKKLITPSVWWCSIWQWSFFCVFYCNFCQPLRALHGKIGNWSQTYLLTAFKFYHGFVSWDYYDGSINYLNHWFSFPPSLTWKDFKIWGIIFWWSHMQYGKPKAVFFALGLITLYPTYQCFVTELHEHLCLQHPEIVCVFCLADSSSRCDNSPHPYKGAKGE